MEMTRNVNLLMRCINWIELNIWALKEIGRLVLSIEMPDTDHNFVCYYSIFVIIASGEIKVNLF